VSLERADLQGNFLNIMSHACESQNYPDFLMYMTNMWPWPSLI
jgi:hypothetical protein